MMKQLLTLILLSIPFAAFGQQGSISYDEIMKIEIQLPPEMESMRDQIPDSRTTAKELLFDEMSSLYRNRKDADDDGDIEMGGEGIMIRMGGPSEDNATFTDLEEETIVDRREFMGRTFRITGEREPLEWRLTHEQSEFLGFLCQKAVAERDSSTVEAWFTPEIPLAIGPAEYGGLPGAMLVVSVDDGRLTFTATEVALGEVDAGELEPPSGGREVSQEEFDAIVEEKMKEMGAQGGRGGGMFHVRIEN